MRELATLDSCLLYLVFVVIAISMVLHTINLIVLNRRLGFGDVVLLYRELHKKYFTFLSPRWTSQTTVSGAILADSSGYRCTYFCRLF